MIKLFKRTCFITETIFTTSNGDVFEQLIPYLRSLSKDTDILCESFELFDMIRFELDLSNDYVFTKTNTIYTNADFTFYPVSKDLIKPNELTIVIGAFENVTKYKRIHQIAFCQSNAIIRIGVKI